MESFLVDRIGEPCYIQYMRPIAVSTRAKKSVRSVWSEASDLNAWPRFVEAFAGYNLKFRSEIVAGPHDPPGMGTELTVSRSSGPPLMRCRIAWWDPLRGFTVAAQSGGWLTAYHGTFTLRLSELDESLTSMELSMQCVFLNRFVELVSLLLPVGFLYHRRLGKVLGLIAPKP